MFGIWSKAWYTWAATIRSQPKRRMDLAVWRDISVLWLALLSLIVVLPFGVLFFLAVRNVQRLRPLVKRYLPLVQERANGIAAKTERASQKITGPIIGVYTRAAQINGFRRAIWTRRKRSHEPQV